MSCTMYSYCVIFLVPVWQAGHKNNGFQISKTVGCPYIHIIVKNTHWSNDIWLSITKDLCDVQIEIETNSYKYIVFVCKSLERTTNEWWNLKLVYSVQMRSRTGEERFEDQTAAIGITEGATVQLRSDDSCEGKTRFSK